MLVSCGGGPDLKAQCNTIAQVNNNTLKAVMDNRIGKPVYDATVSQQSAQAYKDGVKAIEALEISDQKLKEIQTSLADAYKNSATLNEQMAGLMPANNRPSSQVEQQISSLMQQVDKGIPEAIQAHKLHCVGG